MVFEGLAVRLQSVFSKLRGKGKVNEDDVNDAMREVRLALLEADVNFKVVKQFISKLKEKVVGQEVMRSFTPGMVIIDIVNKELTELMGSTAAKLVKASKSPTVIMMVGLQGAGKTTTSGKLAKMLLKQGHRPLLVAADIYRPAAIKQLQVVGEQCKVPVFALGDQTSPIEIAKRAIEHTEENNFDYVIIDTAGRLHIDEPLMEELKQIYAIAKPDEVLLVVDAMTGQDVVNVAISFNEQLGLTGVILAKLDGDTRGGAALSVKAVTGCPIKFVTLGEKVDALEPFHPERMASRILGMGDMLSLIEKAQAHIDAEKAKEMEVKMRNATFTFDDFFEQMQQIKKLGSIDQILDMIPGMHKMKQNANLKMDERQINRVEAIICSMTNAERQDPDLINYSRRKRIALGSGTSLADVNRLIKQFDEMRRMMKQFSNMMGLKGSKMMKGLKNQVGKAGRGKIFPFR